MEYVPRLIIVHHSAAKAPSPQFAAINQWHKQRGFPLSTLGFYVGYHAVIEGDGTLRAARIDTERDADTLGHNFDSLSVCLVGNFDTTTPTTAQIGALGALLSAWCKAWSIDASRIYPHRKFQAKSCYGAKLSDTWAREVYLKHELASLLP